VSAPLRQGQIVRATIADPQGGNPKRRPVVIVSETAAIVAGGEVVVIAITTQVGSFPAEVSVALPWHRGGHPRTTLTQRGEAICTWQTGVPVDDVEAPVGRVPVPEMSRIMEILAALNATPPPTTN